LVKQILKRLLKINFLKILSDFCRRNHGAEMIGDLNDYVYAMALVLPLWQDLLRWKGIKKNFFLDGIEYEFDAFDGSLCDAIGGCLVVSVRLRTAGPT
jgi:hypothetical protein